MSWRKSVLAWILFVFASVWLPREAAAETDTVRSKWIDLPNASSSKNTARGLLLVPQNNFGDLPAIILIGDCQKPRPFQKTWAHRLASQGYVTFLLDPGFKAHDQELCTSREVIQPLLQNANRYMEQLVDIHIDSIAVINWGYLLPHNLGELSQTVAAAVSFYPKCTDGKLFGQSFPRLVFGVGGPSYASCRYAVHAANETGARVHLRIYPDAKVGFDNPNASVTADTENANVAYDLAAHQDSIKRVDTFVNKHLQVTLAQPYPSKAFSPLPSQLDRDETPRVTTGYGTWTHDPASPGPNRPPIGSSVFDRVFSKTTETGTVYDLPDNFQAVVARISRFVSTDRRGLSPIKQVLIPHGRSLQREAAKPNYYDHPRIVIAVDGEPANTWPGKPLFLKDRLFMGYQETSQTLEIISYNEPAARFEFQVVNNFGPGLKPEILYADRQLCTSCHQNGAPLFPREEWQETNGSRDTKKRLKAIMDQYQGVSVDRGGEIPAAIDVSTDRANLLPVLQRLWREGCGSDSNLSSNQCRASAFEAMLQYRLSNDNSFDRDDPAFKSQYTNRLTTHWRKFWPNGLYISNSDIPDRNPTIDASIFGLRDPLTPRVPMEIWTGFKRSDLERMIVAMAEDLPHRDIGKLDAWIASVFTQNPKRTETLSATCSFTRQLRRGLTYPVTVTCSSSDLSFSGALTDWNTAKISGEIIDIQIKSFDIRDRQNLVQVPASDPSKRSFKILLNDNFMRLPNGRRLSEIEFSLDKKRLAQTATGTVKLTVLDDFHVVRRALTKITNSEFTNKPYHGPKLLSKLFEAMGAQATNWCCEPDFPGPQQKMEETITPIEIIKILNAQNPEHILGRYCARCHRTHNSVPANFLFGDKQRVATGIDHCAARMAYRLSMWEVPVHERTRSPMPPESVLPSLGFTKTEWRNSQELATLRRYVESLIATDRDRTISYENLQSCLTKPEQASAAK